ncbi:P-loop containing nucleoside triphosphate hydrolase protein, partial [Colletotrichum caudatum]
MLSSVRRLARRVARSTLDDPDEAPLLVVYFHSVDEAKSVAAELGAPVYYADMSGEERSKALHCWLTEAHVLCATSAFGVGIDESRTVAVAHWKLPFSLIDWVQMAGRGSRNGSPSTAVIFTTPGQTCGDAALRAFLDAPCRRASVVGYLD